MVHVGAGWAAARIPWIRRNFEGYLRQFDPLLCWLAVDGYGFHQGFFHGATHIRRQVSVDRLLPYARRAFDQGLGRSLWFVEGASISQIKTTIDSFEAPRHADLWSGVGLACAYAGGADGGMLKDLRDAGRRYVPEIAQGMAFAAKTRQRAGILTAHTDLACRVLCGTSATECACITDECLVDLPAEGDAPRYERWRQRIQQRFRGG
jgi:hypothetical protein